MEVHICICKHLPANTFSVSSIKRDTPGRKNYNIPRQSNHTKLKNPRIEKHNRK